MVGGIENEKARCTTKTNPMKSPNPILESSNKRYTFVSSNLKKPSRKPKIKNRVWRVN